MTDKARLETSVGVVTEALPNAFFRVKLVKREKEVLAYLSGKMRLNKIKVLIGDSVEVVLIPTGARAELCED